MLKEITCHRSIWAYRYAEMVRERQLQLPEHDLALSSSQLEASVRRSQLIDRHWHRASPRMNSLRLVDISNKDRNFFEGIFLAPGGRWLLLFNSTAVDVVDLEDSSTSPEPFFRLSDAAIQGHCHSVFSTVGSRDGESLVFFATINSVDRSVLLSFDSGRSCSHSSRRIAHWARHLLFGPPTFVIRLLYPGSWDASACPIDARKLGFRTTSSCAPGSIPNTSSFSTGSSH